MAWQGLPEEIAGEFYGRGHVPAVMPITIWCAPLSRKKDLDYERPEAGNLLYFLRSFSSRRVKASSIESDEANGLTSARALEGVCDLRSLLSS